MQQGKQQITQKEKSKIITIVRVRPNLVNEDQRQCISLLNKTTLQIQIGGLKRLCKIQQALTTQSTQRKVFQIVQPLLLKSMEGFNISLLAYGQTGSGKTHTMFGSDWNNIVKLENQSQKGKIGQATFLRSIQQDENYAGIIPRTINLLFNRLIVKRRKFIKVYCSFMQIYNEQMADLLQDDPKIAKQQKLLIHQNKKDGIYVQGLNEIVVEDPQQCLDLMRRGQKNRIVRQTYMNAKSSRSHTIFTLLIEEVFPSKKSYRRMKINLCDLAGSQKVQKGQSMTVAHFEQLKNINLSLTTLGKVIGALATGNQIAPYRQSKLTRLLQDSLGGNTNTAIIATVTSKMSCVEESFNTLKFLQRARQVKGEVVAQIYSDNPEMRTLEKQINYLRDILKVKGKNLPTDIQLREKYKHVQLQNQKLKEIVDKGLIEKLKKQNIHLKQQLQLQKNDFLSESFLGKKPIYYHNTIDNNDFSDSSPSQPSLKANSSTGNTNKFMNQSKNDQESTQGNIFRSKDRSRNFASRTDDSRKSNAFQRQTKNSVFPKINHNGTRAASTILQRIMQIQKAKLQNKLRFLKKLELLQNQITISKVDSKNQLNKKY